jgi:hypothetical protein
VTTPQRQQKYISEESAPKRNLFSLDIDASAPSQMPDPDGSDSDESVNFAGSDGSDIHSDDDTASGIDGRAEANHETRNDSYQGPPDSIEAILDEYDRDEDAANMDRQEASKQQKFKDANAVLVCIAHLAATGSQKLLKYTT